MGSILSVLKVLYIYGTKFSRIYQEYLFYGFHLVCVFVYIFCAVFQGQKLALDITYLVGRSIKSAAVSSSIMDVDVFCSD